MRVTPPPPPASLPNSAGMTPLHAAARGGHEPLVRALLRHGADASARDASGRTPMDVAATYGRTAALQRLQMFHTPVGQPIARSLAPPSQRHL
jgi:ankyrin repeat protein